MNFDFGSIGNFVKGVASTATQIYAAKAQIEAAKAASQPASPKVTAAQPVANMTYQQAVKNDRTLIAAGLLAGFLGLWLVLKK